VIVTVTILLASLCGLLGLDRLVFLVGFAGLITTLAIGFAFAFVLLLAATAIAGLAAGTTLIRRLELQAGYRNFATLALGVLLIVVATAVPIAGWLLQLVVACFGLGALLLSLQRSPESAKAVEAESLPMI
jgi:hypothetical protein